MPHDDSAASSQSLERGLAILGSFSPDRPALGISELAKRLSLTRSTTHRYVATLARLGFLDQDESTRKYRLGIRVLDLGFAVLGSLELREIAAPYLQRLTAATGHTSNLAIRDDTDVIRSTGSGDAPAVTTTSSSTCTSAPGCRRTAARRARRCSRSCRRTSSTSCSTASSCSPAARAR